MAGLKGWGVGALAIGSLASVGCAKDAGDVATAPAVAEVAQVAQQVEAAPAAPEAVAAPTVAAGQDAPAEIHGVVAGLIRSVAETPELAGLNAVEAKFNAIRAEILRPMAKAFVGRDAKALWPAPIIARAR